MSGTGLRVLVTRPAAQSARIAQLIRDRGMTPLLLPLFEIVDSGDGATHRARLASTRTCDGWIFSSVNAAHRVHALAQDLGPWPTLYAIGESTARVLIDAGHAPVHVSDSGNTSEDLLALPGLQAVERRRFLVCTGEGGRDMLASELRRRGAEADRLELYRRVAIQHPADHVRDMVSRSDATICTSGDGLHRLHTLVPVDLRAGLTGRLLVVPSQRVLELARHLGFTEVRTPLKTSDEALVDRLVHPEPSQPSPDAGTRRNTSS
jgi:uroporphyrinogen-III synthase